MPHYTLVFVTVIATLIAATAVLRRLPLRLSARIRTLELPRAQLRSSTPLAASVPIAADWESSESSLQIPLFEHESGWHGLDAPYRVSADETLINPATGLPMVGGVDLAGNFYGFDSSAIGFDAASLFNDSASFECGFAAFESTSSFASPSSFD